MRARWIAALVAVAGLLGLPAAAAAGGWATVSLSSEFSRLSCSCAVSSSATRAVSRSSSARCRSIIASIVSIDSRNLLASVLRLSFSPRSAVIRCSRSRIVASDCSTSVRACLIFSAMTS